MDCMMLEWPTFVVQRRVNVVPAAVLEVVLDRKRWGRGAVVASAHDGALQLDAPFALAAAGPLSRWRAPARLVTTRGRNVGLVEIEIGVWSPHDTELVVRPRARHPERWSGRRMRRYFTHAHRRADQLTCMLGATALPSEASPAVLARV
jgi:hypothetical protein